jgi:hypothetical protein
MIPVVTDALLIEREFVKFTYACKTKQATWCIADFSGNILKRDHYEPGQQFSIASLPKGLYTFCIVDGDTVVKAKFQKHQ